MRYAPNHRPNAYMKNMAPNKPPLAKERWSQCSGFFATCAGMTAFMWLRGAGSSPPHFVSANGDAAMATSEGLEVAMKLCSGHKIHQFSGKLVNLVP